VVYVCWLQARLKGSIRDPNAPELVHFLFVPLSLIVEACSNGIEPGESSGRLVSRVIAPLLTTESHELLDNCLTSKESELLRSLGSAWTTCVLVESCLLFCCCQIITEVGLIKRFVIVSICVIKKFVFQNPQLLSSFLL